MKIDIWSDVVCPFCYIGKRHLEKAMEKYPGLDVEITWRSFELDPNAPKDSDLDIYDTLAKKYGRDRDWAKQMNERVVNMAADVELDYRMDQVKPSNSFDAHRLLHYAKEKGKQHELKEKLFSGYFTEGKKISDHKVLKELAGDVGLDTEEAEKILAGEEYAEEVHADINQARQINVQGVPFFLINERYGLSGAQPVETFEQVLEEVQNQERETGSN